MNDLLDRGVLFLKITILVMANYCGIPLNDLIFIAFGHREEFCPARDRIQTSGFMSVSSISETYLKDPSVCCHITQLRNNKFLVPEMAIFWNKFNNKTTSF